jgi:hypothetical protein
MFALALAGCVGSSSTDTQAPESSTTAPPPTADATTGAISGLVLDDEVRPISGATVVLVETQAETQTDDQGRFTFNNLPPGTVRILASRLGYDGGGIKVQVIAGEVVEAKIVLKPMVLNEPYVRVAPRNAMMHVSVTSLTSLQNESVISQYACNPCRLPMHLDKNPSAIYSEGQWADGPTPVINAALNVWYYRDWSGSGLGTNMCYWQPSTSPYRIAWSETCVGRAKGIDKMLVHIQPGPIPGNVAIELKVETWTSFFYNQEMPEDYTALPPS